MSRKCELSGKGVLSGNLVSHSQRKTRRCFKPNVRVASFRSDVLGQVYTFRVAANCIRSIDKVGGFDEYMLRVSNTVLSDRAKSAKRLIVQQKAQVVNEA